MIATAACAVPHRSPRLLSKSPIDIPPDAFPDDSYRDVRIVVSLDRFGHVRSARVFKSSGAPKFDAAMLRAARGSSYAPEILDCKPAPSRFLFVVENGSGTPAPRGPVGL